MVTEISENEMRGVCVIDVEDDGLHALMRRLGGRCKKQIGAHPPTIFRVPSNIRKSNPDAYAPKIISFGPYHHGNPHLKAMDNLKLQYLRKILRRNTDLKLEDYYQKVKSLEIQGRSCYADEHKILKSDEFVTMLLLDGCFIVELLLLNGGEERGVDQVESDGDEDDPITDTMWALALVEFDMLKLENQVPLFVLDAVFDLATARMTGKPYTLVDLAIRFFHDLFPSPERIPSAESVKSFNHLLHLFHSCMKPAQQHRQHSIHCWSTRRCCEPAAQLATPQSVPCAMELEDSGVEFKKTKKAGSFLDVRFGYGLLCNGMMSIPQLHIHDETDALFRNLIAFEQCYQAAGDYITAYAVFMDRIIDTPGDVALLQRRGVIVNSLGSDEDAAALFNKLCKGAAFDAEKSYLAGVFIDVEEHCKSRVNKWRAKLMRGYFSNPWSLLSLFGALIILSLTVIQTAFSVRAFYYPPS